LLLLTTGIIAFFAAKSQLGEQEIGVSRVKRAIGDAPAADRFALGPRDGGR
jgi:hypothetical protein